MSKSLSFGHHLAHELAKSGLTRVQLGHRLGVSSTQIGFWITGERVPPEARQRKILAALHASTPTLATLVESLQRDVAERIAQFGRDAETIATATPAEAAETPEQQRARALFEKTAAELRRPARRKA